MKTSIRTDTKLWRFFEAAESDRACPAEGGIYVFGYTWFEARTGALAALQRSSGLVHGREIENIKEHLVEAGSTIVFVDRGSTWFEIVETLRRMSGEEARKLLAFPAFGGASPFEPDSSMEGGPDEAVVDRVVEENMSIRTSTRKLESSLTRASVAESIADDAIRELVSLRAVVGAARYWVRNFPKGVPVAVGPDTDLIDAVRAYEDETRNLTPAEVELKAYHDRLEETVRRLQGELEAKELERFRAARQAEEYRVMGKAQEKELIETRRQARLVPADAGILCNCDEFKKRLLVASEMEKRLTMEKDAAYDERNRLVALFASMALAMGWKAGVGQHEDPAVRRDSDPASPNLRTEEVWDPEWRTLVVVETPEGQASWHFHDSQNHLVKHLPSYVAKWDGHDTPMKYARLQALAMKTLAAAREVPRVEVRENVNEAYLVVGGHHLPWVSTGVALTLKAPLAAALTALWPAQPAPSGAWEAAALECDKFARGVRGADTDEMAPLPRAMRAGYLNMAAHFRTLSAPGAGGVGEASGVDWKRLYENATDTLAIRDAEIERLRRVSVADAAATTKAVDYAESARERIEAAVMEERVKHEAFEKRTRHQLSEFMAACSRADAAEFALVDARIIIGRMRSVVDAACAWVGAWGTRRCDVDLVEATHAYQSTQIVPISPKSERYETAAIREIGGCGAIAGTKPHEQACLLPMGHTEPHGWDCVSGRASSTLPESSVVVRLESAQGGFRAVVASPHDGGFVMMDAMDVQDDAQFYVDSANKALAPFLQAAYRSGLLKGAQECRTMAKKMDDQAVTSFARETKDAFCSKKNASNECASLIEALAKVAR